MTDMVPCTASHGQMCEVGRIIEYASWLLLALIGCARGDNKSRQLSALYGACWCTSLHMPPLKVQLFQGGVP
jgi:hypothetical protein